jgi:mannose-6-phosphate isomerase-like protein (cupin superfamily)
MSLKITHADYRRIQSFLVVTVALAALTLTAVGAGENDKTAGPSTAEQPGIIVQSFDSAPHDKTPWGSLRWLMTGKIDPQSHMTLGIAELKPGYSNPIHIHDNCEEVMHVLSGSCEQRIGDRTVILKAGDTICIPAGVPHTAKVLGSEPVRSVVAYNSGDRHFKPVKDK